MTNKTCDDCGVKLQGACFVDGSSLLCADCAENLAYESEMNYDYYDESTNDYSERMWERKQMGLSDY